MPRLSVHNPDAHNIEIAFRIPGRWDNPKALNAALPNGYQLGERDGVDGLLTPVGDVVGCGVRPYDDQFLEIFARACRNMPSERDREIVENWQVQICLWGPGGSFERAHRLMKAASAILQAGGGVFIDNTGAAHGSDDWHTLTNDPANTSEDGDRGGIYWAFAAAIGDKRDVYTLGMHALGLKDAVMPRGFGGLGTQTIEAAKADHDLIHNFVAYTYRSGVELHDGDLVGNECLPRPARITHEGPPRITADKPGHAMHNPFGRWRLTPMNQG